MNPMPNDPPVEPIPLEAAIPAALTPQRPRSTASKLFGLLIVVICFEVGVFLVVFPWLPAWGTNSIPMRLPPAAIDLWESNYFRGALSGLGLVNIWISFQEMLRLLRG